MQPAIHSTPNSGSDARLEALFQEHGSLVFRSALRVTGNESDAEDVVQTVFMRLMAHGHVERLDERPVGYLRRAATNAALDVLRRRKTARAVPLDNVELRLADPGRSPAGQVDDKALHLALRGALAELSPRAAEVFTMRFFEGMKNPEIAEVLGTSAAVVAVTLHRARRTLQRAMHDFVGDN